MARESRYGGRGGRGGRGRGGGGGYRRPAAPMRGPPGISRGYGLGAAAASVPVAPEVPIDQRYLASCLPILHAIVPENPIYKEQVGTALYDYV